MRHFIVGIVGAVVLSSVFVTSMVHATALHLPWQQLLQVHVQPINQGHSTAVDYDAIKLKRSQLQAYLTSLAQISRTEFDLWPAPRQLAFLLNAYNAWTVELILTQYPDVESIKDLGSFFRSPWRRSFIPLLGKEVSLDDIEHDWIRGSGRYQDPRIHFAVNCASIGCPALREEAYTEAQLELQLEAQAYRFLGDTSRNRIQGDTLYLSSIFKWYRQDFETGFRGSDSVETFILLYGEALQMTPVQRDKIERRQITTEFLDYDWALNGRH